MVQTSDFTVEDCWRGRAKWRAYRQTFYFYNPAALQWALKRGIFYIPRQCSRTHVMCMSIPMPRLNNLTQRWNLQYGGGPSAFCEVGVREDFPHNLVRYGWPVLRANPCLFGACVSFVPRGFMSLKRGPCTNKNFIWLIYKMSMEGHLQIFKNIHAGLIFGDMQVEDGMGCFNSERT